MTVGWGMVGTGRVNHWVAEAIAQAAGAELVAVASRDQARGEAFARAHGARSAYNSVERLAEDPAVDVVYVASPNSCHEEHVVTVAEGGKHILCEKPMALDAAACAAMIEACRRGNVHLGLSFQFRQHPAHLFMRDVLRSGSLGAPVFADVAVYFPTDNVAMPAWYDDPAVAGGGSLQLMGVHRIDLLRFVLGAEVAEVSAFVTTRRPGRRYEDTTVAMLRFDNGVVATLRCGLDVALANDPVAVHCSGGWISGTRTLSQMFPHRNGTVAVSSGQLVTAREFAPVNLYLAEVAAFCETVATGVPFAATGTDGLRGVEIAAAIYQAAAEGRAVRVDRGPDPGPAASPASTEHLIDDGEMLRGRGAAPGEPEPSEGLR